jgi:hypothetical protein
MAGLETDCGIAFGTIGKSLKERERISYDWALTKTTLMLGVEHGKVVGQLHRVLF